MGIGAGERQRVLKRWLTLPLCPSSSLGLWFQWGTPRAEHRRGDWVRRLRARGSLGV